MGAAYVDDILLKLNEIQRAGNLMFDNMFVSPPPGSSTIQFNHLEPWNGP